MFKEFQSIYPNLSKQVIRYHPHMYYSIYVFLEDGTVFDYNCNEKRATIVRDYKPDVLRGR